jgi:hypothetical protein
LAKQFLEREVIAMHPKHPARTLAACVSVVAGLSVCAGRAEQKLPPEELVARHLSAIGTAEARAAVEARLATGNCGLRVVVGETLKYEGTARVASEGRRHKITLHFGDPTYWGEQILFDDERADVGFVQPAQRSALGGFLSRYNGLVREGLVGGVLTTAWPLLDVAGRQPKLESRGLRRVDGRDLYRLDYKARKGPGDVTVCLFFDPPTFQHVRSTYTYSRAQPLGTDIVQSSQQRETRYELEERFEEFRMFDGLTLPTRWTLQYTADTTSRITSLAWEIRIESIARNPRLDPSTFTMEPSPRR